MPQSILELEPPKADRRVSYGADPFHFADLRFPAGKPPFPVVMNIHGGFWRAQYDLTHAGHSCAALTKAGFATFNIEYRRVGNPGGGWPGSFEDVRNAYAYLRQQAKDIGFDSDRVIVMGHSAGGQLAICLASHEPTVAGVVSLAGVLDLKRAYELHLSQDAVVEFLGGTPDQIVEHYREAAPMNQKVRARQSIIAGKNDDIVPPEFSRKYVEVKKAAGENIHLVEIDHADHFALIDPRSSAFKTVLSETQKLL